MTKTKSQKLRAKQAKKNGSRNGQVRRLPSVREMRKLEKALEQLLGNPAASANGPIPYNKYSDIGLSVAARPRPKKERTKGKAKVPLNPAFSSFLKANSSAFTDDLALPVFSFNPEPSLAARSGKCIANFSLNVASNHEVWFLFGQTDSVSSDGSAEHCLPWMYGGSGYNMLPFNTDYPAGASNAAFCCYKDVVVASGVPAALTDQWVPVPPIQKWPVGGSTTGGHQRAMFTCYGMVVDNITPIGTRGGEHLYVHPTTQSASDGQWNSFNLPYMTGYKKTGASHLEIHFPARPHDLVYSHMAAFPTVTEAGNGVLSNPCGIYVFRNQTGSPQTLDITVGAKYAVAGNLPAALLAKVDPTPQHINAYEAASSAVTGGQVHSSHFAAVAGVAHAAQQAGQSVVDKIGAFAKGKAAEIAKQGVAGAMGALGFAAA